MLSGFCYTQFADTYQEANGLLYPDRRPKIPLARIATATRGSAAPRACGLAVVRPLRPPPTDDEVRPLTEPTRTR